MVNYVSLAATAKRLIDSNGRDVTLAKLDRTPADVNKPWRAGGGSDTTTGPLKAVIVPFEAEDDDGAVTRSEDMVAYVAASDTDPAEIETYDRLLDGADVWRIKKVITINPGDTRVVYEIMIER